jgi:hypothetical protein
MGFILPPRRRLLKGREEDKNMKLTAFRGGKDEMNRPYSRL